MKAALIALLLALLAPFAAQAVELREFYIGGRAQSMGGAFVAVADDEQAIFMNPAGLAGNTKYTFHYIVADLMASTDTVMSSSAVAKAFSNPSGSAFNVLMGKNIDARAQIAPTLLMPNFGVSILVDGQAELLTENQALPQITLGYQVTNGIQLAYGVSVMKGRGRNNDSDLRVGFATKLLWRRGGYYLLPTMTLLTISKDTLSQLAGNFERGVGLDLGAQYVRKVNKRLKLSSALVFNDIGDTSFGGQAAAIKGDLVAGIAAEYSLYGASKAIFAYDYRHILDQADWRKKNHFGVELALPLLSFYGGINQVSFTYGVGFDAWLFRVNAYSYCEELGGFVRQASVRRWSLKLALKFDL